MPKTPRDFPKVNSDVKKIEDVRKTMEHLLKEISRMHRLNRDDIESLESRVKALEP